MLKGQCIATTSGVIRNNLLLPWILDVNMTKIQSTKHDYKVDCFVGWGRKKSYYRTKALADKYQKPIITIEDGFLRSLDSGTTSRYGVSLVVDDVGIYFDTRNANRLENLIVQLTHDWHDNDEQHAKRLIKTILDNHLSKYNHQLSAPNLTTLANNNKSHVLIIDQVANDASIEGAGADKDSFLLMLEQAKKLYPNANIWIKAHPTGKGYFDKETLARYNIDEQFCLVQSCNPIKLLWQVDAVFTVSSHMGFEALMLGKTVYGFGVAWYSGFGLTCDDFAPQSLLASVKARRESLGMYSNPTLTMLFYASYVRYSCYGDPASYGIGLVSCDIETAIDWLITNRNHAHRLAGEVLSYEFSRWKWGFFGAFLGTPFNTITIKPKAGLVRRWLQSQFGLVSTPCFDRPYPHVVVWGQKARRMLESANLPMTKLWCMEDGFIRSKGLGATLLEPLSVVIDDKGIYYDATHPSLLESYLATIELTDEECQKIQALLAQITTAGITKYNVGKATDLPKQLTQLGKHKPVHLVVGQVEDDASVQNCLSAITTNQALLYDVRRRYPEDIIIYKPHPDVEAGLRVGLVNDTSLADIVAYHSAMTECLAVCDVVHTISSQTGFEALIRHKQVVCYGLPFYAGFGLTSDIPNDDERYHQALARRTRATPLSIEALAFATLIKYPLYRLPNGYGLAQPHQLVAYLTKQNANPPTPTPTDRVKRRLMQWHAKTTNP